MTNPTLDDLTRALTNAVARNIQRDLSGVHDSDECDCEMCAAAEEYEAREAQGVSKATSEPEMSLSGLEIAGTSTQNDGRGSLWANAATIRMALMDVIDEGCRSGRPVAGRYRCSPWVLDDKDEDYANAQRSKFADAVLRRLVELQSPPHNAPRLENFCPRHRMVRLPRPAVSICGDCQRERRKGRGAIETIRDEEV
jgi:hypothetical protein